MHARTQGGTVHCGQIMHDVRKSETNASRQQAIMILKTEVQCDLHSKAYHTAHEDLDWPHARILQLNLALATGVVLQPKC